MTFRARNAHRIKQSGIGITGALILLILAPLSGTAQESDSLQAGDYPEKIKIRKTWEHWVNIPGTILQVPFRLVFEPVEYVAPRIYESWETGFINQVVESVTWNEGRSALRPTFGSRTGVGLKLYKKDLAGDDSKLSLKASAWFDGRQKYSLEGKRLQLAGHRFRADFAGTYWYMMEESFFGIGPYTREDDELMFTREQSSALFRLNSRLCRRVDLSLSALYEQNNIYGYQGDDDDPSIYTQYSAATLPGLGTRIRLFTTEAELEFDLRNKPGGATSGQFIRLAAAMAAQAGGDDYGFTKLTADFRQFIHLFYGRKLILRTAVETITPQDGKTVPFTHLSILGLDENLRGFERGRFRDLDRLFVSAEYHYPVWGKFDTHLDAVLFIDAGQVSDDIVKNADLNDFNVGFGVGFNLWNSEEELGNIYIGFSREEEFTIHFAVGL